MPDTASSGHICSQAMVNSFFAKELTEKLALILHRRIKDTSLFNFKGAETADCETTKALHPPLSQVNTNPPLPEELNSLDDERTLHLFREIQSTMR